MGRYILIMTRLKKKLGCKLSCLNIETDKYYKKYIEFIDATGLYYRYHVCT